MVFATTTVATILQGIGSVSSSTYDSISAYLFLFAGIILVWYIIEEIRFMLWFDKKKQKRLEYLRKKQKKEIGI